MKSLHPGLLLTAMLLMAASTSAGDQLSGDKEESGRPNVIVILTDDQGWGDLSHHGNQNLDTPNLDRLATEGVSFDRFYVCPVCSPTRAEFLTGRYHGRVGVYSTSAGGERLNLGEQTIAEHFKASGYRTACYGKWHNGTQFPYHPKARGFDDYYGFCSGHWGHYYSPLIDDNGYITEGNGFLPDDLTDHAISKIREVSDSPFFIYLPFNTPHSPMQVPDRWWNKVVEKELVLSGTDPLKENQQHTRAALAMCENVDWNVGRILKALDDTDQRQNTLIAYFCDNGPNGVRWNGGMKGRKGSTDEGGVRSPLFLNWPKALPPGIQVERNAAAIDLFPTLAGLAGVPVKDHQHLDGIDLSPTIYLENSGEVDDRVIVSQWKQKISVKSGRYRLDQRGDLYDLLADPGQTTPVKDQNAIKLKLSKSMRGFQDEILPDYGKDDRPFVIGHPSHQVTQIPIRDATFTGNIKRSNRFPNSSFAKDWTSVKDEIRWEVQVDTGGLFQVQIYYTVSQQDIGSKIRLSFGDQSVSAKVEEAVPPVEVGRTEDRVKRTESYEQDWGQMTLGTIHLHEGSGAMVLESPSIAGKEVMQVRLMTLTRVEEEQRKQEQR